MQLLFSVVTDRWCRTYAPVHIRTTPICWERSITSNRPSACNFTIDGKEDPHAIFAHSDRQRDAEGSVREIYDFCAQKISLIPQKNKDNLMVRIETDGDTFKYGKETPCAFVDVRLFGPAPKAAKEAFAQALGEKLQETAQFGPGEIYMNFIELDHWATGDSFRTL